MFSNIKTSQKNKETITELTRRFELKSENVIARLALAYSLENDDIVELTDILDSKGKEFSKKVLLGDYVSTFLGMISVKYNISINDKDIGRYLKMHLDLGAIALKDVKDLAGIFHIMN